VSRTRRTAVLMLRAGGPWIGDHDVDWSCGRAALVARFGLR
jgi:hypothetical protein